MHQGDLEHPVYNLYVTRKGYMKQELNDKTLPQPILKSFL
jgi:hypothetical protein